MSLWSRVRDAYRALTRSAGPAGYGMGVAWSGGPLYADRFGAKRGPSPWQLIEAHKQIGWACGEYNAQGVSQQPLRLYAASGPGRSKPRSISGPRTVSRSTFEHLGRLAYIVRTFGSDVRDVHEITGPEVPILKTLGNPAEDPETGLRYFDRCTLIATLIRYLDVVGVAYLKPESPEGMPYSELIQAQIPPPLLWPLQAQYVWPIRRPDSALIKAFKYFTEDYSPRDLMYIRMRPSLRDPYGAGYSAAQASWQYLGLEDSSISMWDQLLGTGARPNLIATPEDPNMAPGDDERVRFEKEMNTYHARGRAGRFLASTGGWKFTPINYPGWDLGELAVDNYMLERIANCYGVPISFLTRETNLANFQAGRTFHAVFGIEPRAQCIAAALTELVQRYDDRLFFAFDCSVPEDKLTDAKILMEQVKAGLVTGNEANSDQPWAEKPWLEEPWIPQTLVQPSMAQERHEQGLEAQREKFKAAAEGKSGTDGRRPPAGPSDREERVLRRTERVLRRIERELSE